MKREGVGAGQSQLEGGHTCKLCALVKGEGLQVVEEKVPVGRECLRKSRREPTSLIGAHRDEESLRVGIATSRIAPCTAGAGTAKPARLRCKPSKDGVLPWPRDAPR